MKIRIFALAKELGLDSKELIQHCNDAGLNVKSSPLASISPEERDMVLGYMKRATGGASGKAEKKASASDVQTPSRDMVMERAAKSRPIRTLPVGPRKRTDEDEEQESDQGDIAVETPEEFQEPARSIVEQAVPKAEPAPPPPTSNVSSATTHKNRGIGLKPGKSGERTATAAPVAPLAPVRPPASKSIPGKPTGIRTIGPRATPKPGELGPKSVPSVAAVLENVEESVALESVDVPVAPARVPPPAHVSPGEEPESPPVIVAEDQAKAPESLPAATRGLAGVRDMRPQGTVRDMRPGGSARREPGTGSGNSGPLSRSDSGRGDRGKKAPSLPNVVLPNFKPSAQSKKNEGPVQKPVVTFSTEAIKRNRLLDIIKQHKDEPVGGKRKVLMDEEESRRLKSGTSLVDARENRRKGRTKRTVEEEELDAKRFRIKRQKKSSATTLKTSAVIRMPVTIRSLSEELGRPAKDIIRILMNDGKMATMNDSLDEEVVLTIGMELGVDIQFDRPETAEDLLATWLSQADEDFGVPVEPRPPIITILGHVDHGKTTLVDKIRSANVAAGEAGGITQHIAAYQVEHNGKKLTFVDTPGHAAFGEMRARGANVTDIVVLVVAANDGVMPQTIECIAHARAAGVPLVVAMNKMDLPGINQQKVLTDLSNHGVLPSEWGGDTEVVRISGLSGTGVDDLLETLLLTAELNEFKAPTSAAADGVCLEAFRDEGRGPVAWLVVRRGTLAVGDVLLCGKAYGRIRAMYNDRGEELKQAPPSTPVKVAGLDIVPGAGEHFFVMPDIDEARELAEQRRQEGRATMLAGRGGPRTLEQFFAHRDGLFKELPLILKADSPGSIEALKHELAKLQHPEVQIKILHDGVGGVNESDVTLAAASDAIIIAFHVVPEDRAQTLAEQNQVEIRRYNIIYQVADEIRSALEGLLTPEKVEVTTGRALVLRTFSISRLGMVAGCRVLNGTIERSNRVHVIRDQKILNSYNIASLKREKEDARDVREGLECGIRLEGFNDIKEGDLLEAFRIDERKRSLDE